MKLKFLLIFLLKILGIKSQQLSLIGSHLIPSDSDHKVYLWAHNLDANSEVNVAVLDSTYSKISEKINDISGNVFKEIELKLPDNRQDAYHLVVTHTNKSTNECKEQVVEIIDYSQRPIVLIQIDKSIYSTSDVFHYRIFVLNQKLTPFNFNNMEVIITDSENKAIDKVTIYQLSKYGTYENSLQLSETPNLGNWKLQVNVDGYKKSKMFEVQQDSDIQLDLEVSKHVAYVRKWFPMNIIVKKKNEKTFVGTAKISVNGHFQNDDRIALNMTLKTVKVKNGKNEIFIDFKDDMNIQLPTKDMILYFDVVVSEDKSQKSAKVSTKVHMKHKGAHNISFTKNKYFRPGVKFPMKIKVKQLDGQPDKSFERLTMHIDYYQYDDKFKETKIDKKKLLIDLKNGESNVQLHPTSETVKIILDLEFAELEQTEIIEAMPNFSPNNLLKVNLLKKSNKVGEKIYISVVAAEEMNNLHVLAIGSQGIVYSKDYPVEGRDMFNFTMKLTEMMRPESNVIVYYISRSGTVVYETFKLNLGFSLENSLKISTSEEAKPNEMLDVQISSEDGSKVFITAIDEDIDNPDKITEMSLYEEIVRYKNLDFPTTSTYDFSKFNAFVLQPLTAGSPCGSKRPYSKGNYKNLDTDRLESYNAEVIGRKYFSESWFRESFEISGNKTLKVPVPDRTALWQIYGISMHPTKGFTLASKMPKVEVKVKIEIEIMAPTYIRKDEIVLISYRALNHDKNQIYANAEIQFINGLLINEMIERKFDLACKHYTAKGNQNIFEDFVIPAESMSEENRFFVKASNNNPVEVKVTIREGADITESSKIIQVQDEENQKEISNEYLKRDLIGPALEGLDKLFSVQYNLDEYKMNKFTASIIAYKYLQMTRINEKLANDALEKVKIHYQEAFSLINKLKATQNSQYIQLAAQIAKNLIDAKDIIFVDENLILECLNFLKNQQKADGSFPLPYQNPRAEIGKEDFHPQIHTAQVILAFIKDETYKMQFNDEISKSMNYLKSSIKDFKNDYETIIIAYALALNGDQFSNDVLRNIVHNFRKQIKFPKLLSMFVEIASYTIMTKLLNGHDAKDDVNWLLNKRSNSGRYVGPYDTVLAMQALYEFKKSSGNVNIGSIYEEFLYVEPAYELNVFPTVVPTKNSEEMKVEIRASSNMASNKNLIIMEVTLPSGYKYKGYVKADHIMRAESKNDGSLVILYIMNPEKYFTQFIIATKVFDVAEVAAVPVKIYDYYRRNLQGSISYRYDLNDYACHSMALKQKEEDEKSWYQKIAEKLKS